MEILAFFRFNYIQNQLNDDILTLLDYKKKEKREIKLMLGSYI